MAFERPEQAFSFASTQRDEIAIAGILDGLLQLVDELRVEVATLHREIDELKEADRRRKPGPLPGPTT